MSPINGNDNNMHIAIAAIYPKPLDVSISVLYASSIRFNSFSVSASILFNVSFVFCSLSLLTSVILSLSEAF
jgi:hypothetical protein